MSALSTSSCESSLCETPQTISGFQNLIPRPGQSRGVSFESTCVIIPDCEPGKVRRKISIPTLGRTTTATSPTATLKGFFVPKARRRASDQGMAPPLRSCLVRSTSTPSPHQSYPSPSRRASSSSISSASTQTEPLSPCCRSCIPNWEKGLCPGWEIQYSGGAKLKLRTCTPSPPLSPESECDTALARHVKAVDEVECKRAVQETADAPVPVDGPCPRWRSRLCPLSKSAGAGSPAFEVGCASHEEDEREQGDDNSQCDVLKKACTGIWITSRPSSSPSPSRTITPASSSSHLPSLKSGSSTPTISPRPTLVIRTSSSGSVNKSCLTTHSDRVLRSLPNGISRDREQSTPSPTPSIKGYLAAEAATVPRSSASPIECGGGSVRKKSARWLGFGSGVKIGV